MRKFSVYMAALALVICIGSGCSNSASSPSTPSQPFSYEFISYNRNFIGGSLIYDPDSSSGLSQIRAGAKFGVRLVLMSMESSGLELD